MQRWAEPPLSQLSSGGARTEGLNSTVIVGSSVANENVTEEREFVMPSARSAVLTGRSGAGMLDCGQPSPSSDLGSSVDSSPRHAHVGEGLVPWSKEDLVKQRQWNQTLSEASSVQAGTGGIGGASPPVPSKKAGEEHDNIMVSARSA